MFDIRLSVQLMQFERFFRDNYTRVYYFALSLIHEEEAAKDVVGDSFEYMFTHVGDMKHGEAVNYLYTIVRNKCTDYLRRQYVHQRYAEYVLHSQDEEAAFDAHEYEAMVESLQEMIRGLTQRTREILESRYMEGKKYNEMAEELGISESAVKKHIMQALKKFRETLLENYNKKVENN